MSWFSRLKNAIHPATFERDLADEMKDHLERRAASLRNKGLSADEAARQAAVRFGNVMLRREQSRDIRSWAVLDSVLQDARYGWRMMLKNSAFTATAVLSLTLAIGANTAIFSIVDAAILRPLPLLQPERLFTLVSPDIEQPGTGAVLERESFSYPLYLRFRSAAGSSARLGLFSFSGRREARILGATAPLEHVITQFVSGEAFQILGVRPALGRLFSAEEDRTPGGHPFAVLSYEFWRRRFGADPGILGRTIHLGGELGGKSYFVVGVARDGFFGIEPGKFVDIWIPAMMYEREAFTNPGWGWFRIMGRLAPGCAPEQLQARLQPAFHEHQEEMMKRFPTIPSAIRRQFLEMAIRVANGAGGPSEFRRTFARPLWIVLGVAGAILFIACANVASLLLARSTARSTEMSMRIALGASRNRLVRQLVTESLMLSALAGGLGWLTAGAAAPALVNLLSKQSDPVRLALAMDSRMLLFCIAVSAMTAICFGLLPAWQASGVQPMVTLRSTSGGTGKLRAGRFSVAVQVAFSFCLVMTASAFLFSLRNLMLVDTGFDRRNVAVLSMATEWRGKSPELQRGLMDQLQRRVGALPGVQSAALAPWPIFEGGGWSTK
jgi:putative ABC transport system permease protein